jgi:hypothetical protein
LTTTGSDRLSSGAAASACVTAMEMSMRPPSRLAETDHTRLPSVTTKGRCQKVVRAAAASSAVMPPTATPATVTPSAMWEDGGGGGSDDVVVVGSVVVTSVVVEPVVVPS